MEEKTVASREWIGRDDAAYSVQSGSRMGAEIGSSDLRIGNSGGDFGNSGAQIGRSGGDFGNSADGVGRIGGDGGGAFGGEVAGGPGGSFGSNGADGALGSVGPDGSFGDGGLDGAVGPDASDPFVPPTPSPDDAGEIDGAAARQTKSAPGWIKRRIEEGVRRETAALERRLREEYEEKLRPLREAAMDAQADQLVRQGEFRSRERAVEYLRLKSGIAQPPAGEGVRIRAQALFSQAKAIHELAGVDVLALYQNDPAVRNRVLSGEWDFMDVLRGTGGQAEGPRTPPAPVRSANGGAGGAPDVRRMSAGELRRMNEALMRGETFDLRK